MKVHHAVAALAPIVSPVAANAQSAPGGAIAGGTVPVSPTAALPVRMGV